MGGTYDLSNRLVYVIAGADFTVRIDRTSLRMEYLVRRQQFDTASPTIFKYQLSPIDGDYFVKGGAYIELEQPLTRNLDILLRADGMYRNGNVLSTSQLSSRSSVLRETLGFALAVERNFRFKLSGELYRFADGAGAPVQNDATVHLAGVGTF
jgi:hypothetical protein